MTARNPNIQENIMSKINNFRIWFLPIIACFILWALIGLLLAEDGIVRNNCWLNPFACDLIFNIFVIVVFLSTWRFIMYRYKTVTGIYPNKRYLTYWYFLLTLSVIILLVVIINGLIKIG
jgi:hypothetical protein